MIKANLEWSYTPAAGQDSATHFEVWDADLAQHVTGAAVRPDGTFSAVPTVAAPAQLTYTAPGSYGVAIFAVDSTGQRSDPVFVTFSLAFTRPAQVTNATFLGQS